jgi:bifunctional non-homologous end joining protein LigD
MGLAKYNEKRNFGETPEPQGGKAETGQLRFVIQKHDASHLHYDFRLEMEGVLKSWAVPKGPSTDPEVKRLAMMVEDHPYDYRTFEGIIPKGYGAGTVIVWDEGTYEPMDFKSKDKDEQDKELRHMLHAGKIKFTLKGKKLKGNYALIKAHGRGENGWLLLKLDDKYAKMEDILLKDKSVISNKTLAPVEKMATHFYGEKSADGEKPVKKKSVTAPKKKKVQPTEKKTGKSSAKGKKAAFPRQLKPMLATLVDQPFDEPGWWYEVKWDGYRAVAFLNKDQVELKSRNDKSFDEKFYPVREKLERLNLHAVLDGEIVVLNAEGKSDFGDLQNWRSEADGTLVYYVFDLLWWAGKDLTQLTLAERRGILEKVLPVSDDLRLSDVFRESGTEFFEAARTIGLEGIIAKKSDSLYHPAQRSDEWLKIKAEKRQEMVIGGYTINADTTKPFSALLVGYYEQNKLIYAGKVGTGFKHKEQLEMLQLFKSFEQSKIPFAAEPDINKPSRFRPNPPHATAVWLKPKLVCEVNYTEFTKDGVMRHPSFAGMREDKKAKSVVRETAQAVTSVVDQRAEKMLGQPAKPKKAVPKKK